MIYKFVDIDMWRCLEVISNTPRNGIAGWCPQSTCSSTVGCLHWSCCETTTRTMGCSIEPWEGCERYFAAAASRKGPGVGGVTWMERYNNHGNREILTEAEGCYPPFAFLWRLKDGMLSHQRATGNHCRTSTFHLQMYKAVSDVFSCHSLN